jgi:hypothetical protein
MSRELTFEEMWEQADGADAEIGGYDSIPEEEYHDYVEACLMSLADDFKVGRR